MRTRQWKIYGCYLLGQLRNACSLYWHCATKGNNDWEHYSNLLQELHNSVEVKCHSTPWDMQQNVRLHLCKPLQCVLSIQAHMGCYLIHTRANPQWHKSILKAMWQEIWQVTFQALLDCDLTGWRRVLDRIRMYDHSPCYGSAKRWKAWICAQ